ncbi:MAG: peptidoglycan DD-metalloendopeptidase family protein [Ardenticatenaceae bacterium]
MMPFNELIAGLYLALCIIIAFACWHIATNPQRHPLTVAALAVLFALLLRQAWSIAKAPAAGESAIAVKAVEGTNTEPSEVNVPVAPHNGSGGALQTADWSQVWPAVARWQPQIEQAASECGVETALIAAVMRQESVGEPSVCSKAGACGLMQLMPGTAAHLNVQDRFDPMESTRGGACYLRQMLDRYGKLDLALAGYNAGPGNVDKYGGVPPFPETQTYVRKVLAFYQQVGTSTSSNCCEWPVKGRITQQPWASHMALDIAAVVGTPILAADGGVVVGASWAGDYGNRVMIDHGNGLYTLYAHLSKFAVQEGHHVDAGQIIGQVGSTGRSTGPHLHFEVRHHGVLQNPWNYLPAL